MQFNTVTHNDLEAISRLRPEDWYDIVPIFRFYIDSDFCYPVKTEINNTVVGVGAAILFGRTGWIAHVIVSKEHRNKGIGYRIVCELLEHLKKHHAATGLLIATPLGLPVYLKAGFRELTSCVFLKRERPCNALPVSGNIIPFRAAYRETIMQLDHEASGENREKLLSGHLHHALVYRDHDRIQGYYIPGLGEGPIVADTTTAGLELMKIKYAVADTAVLPSGNRTGIRFLEQHGFAPTDKQGTRMLYGDAIHWKPGNIYSRIGGNFG
ncbi:MAG: GNAT family N-acetyltransferase [Sinomicrobium sp.]|nr:GNAT family N-acetyltransferase [Sinomicrobium sp.]